MASIITKEDKDLGFKLNCGYCFCNKTSVIRWGLGLPCCPGYSWAYHSPVSVFWVLGYLIYQTCSVTSKCFNSLVLCIVHT